MTTGGKQELLSTSSKEPEGRGEVEVRRQWSLIGDERGRKEKGQGGASGGMESSFRTRVDRTFGFMLGLNVHHQGSAESEAILSAAEQPESISTATPEIWSVSERAISAERFSRIDSEVSGGDSDDDAAADYRRFVRLERRGRRRRRDDFTADEPEEEDSADEHRERKRRRERETDVDLAVERIEEDEDEEVREMRRMIGRDCTLDFEEEEDEYDKVAVGREGAGERMYMREVTGSCPDICHLPPGHSGALGTFKRDSRANHAAAAARLKEDKEAEARYINSVHNRSGSSTQVKLPEAQVSCLKRPRGDEELSKGGADQLAEKNSSEPFAEESGSISRTAEACEEGKSFRPVDQSGDDTVTRGCNFDQDEREISSKTEDCSSMVRKEKKARTVRFNIADDPSEEKRERGAEITTNSSNENRIPNYDRFPSSVPDHVRNPSKYTHYTLEWSDDEDESKKNLSAFQGFRTLTQEREKSGGGSFTELPHSITFIPKPGGSSLKANGIVVAKPKNDSSSVQVQPSVSFVEAVVDDDLIKTDEISSSSRLSEGKNARVFRKRASATVEDDIDSANVDNSTG